MQCGDAVTRERLLPHSSTEVVSSQVIAVKSCDAFGSDWRVLRLKPANNQDKSAGRETKRLSFFFKPTPEAFLFLEMCLESFKDKQIETILKNVWSHFRNQTRHLSLLGVGSDSNELPGLSTFVFNSLNMLLNQCMGSVWFNN